MLNGYGSILRMERGCYVVQNKKETKKYPQFEEVIGEVVLRSGNTVTVGALASLCFWEIDTLILTRRGKPVGMVRSVEYDSHVKTRLCQYEAYTNDKTMHIGKQIVLAKIKGQNMVLRKYGLNLHKEPRINTHARRVLISIEGTHSKHYFNQIFQLFPKWLIPDTRKTYRAYDGLNNIFNLAYEILKWRVHIALIRAKLEPYLGFLHTVSMGNPSLVSDFQDLYRYLIDDFLIAYCRRLRKKDFIMKQETFSKKRKGKREYLTDSLEYPLYLFEIRIVFF